ncbi:MAG: M48 family metallopeptidase [Alphaproteobacteria bacterium]
MPIIQAPFYDLSQPTIDDLQLLAHGSAPEIESWLNVLVYKIWLALDSEFRHDFMPECPVVYLSSNREINAMILVEHDLAIVNVGLINDVRNEDELVGVLSHEIFHPLIKRKIEYWEKFLTTRDIETVKQRRIDKQEEYGADNGGVRLAAGAGYHPEALADFFERFVTGGAHRLMSYFQTHPNSDQRVREISNSCVLMLREGMVFPEKTPLPAWLPEKLAEIEDHCAIKNYLTQQNFTRVNAAQQIDIIANLLQHHRPLFLHEEYGNRRSSILDAVELIDWQATGFAHHNARSRLGVAVTDLQSHNIRFAKQCYNLANHLWQEANPLEQIEGSENQAIILKKGRSFYPHTNQLQDAVESFWHADHDKTIQESAKTLADLLPRMSAFFEEKGQEGEIYSRINMELYFVYVALNFHQKRLYLHQKHGPVFWNRPVQAYQKTKDENIITSLFYMGVQADPRLPELQILQDKNSKIKVWNGLIEFDEESFSRTYYGLETQPNGYLTARWRPEDPGYYKNGSHLSSVSYHRQLDGWNLYKTIEQQRLKQRDEREKLLIKAIDWGELARDWDGFIHQHLENLRPEYSIYAGGHAFAEKFVQEAIKLAAKNLEYKKKLREFYLGGIACNLAQQAYYPETVNKSEQFASSYFAELTLKPWELEIRGDSFLSKSNKVLGRHLAVQPRHPLIELILKPPIEGLFDNCWQQILLLDSTAYMQQLPDTGVVLAPEYRHLFEKWDDIKDIEQLLKSFLWLEPSTLSKNIEGNNQGGDSWKCPRLLSLYINIRVANALDEGWKPKNLQELLRLEEMVQSTSLAGDDLFFFLKWLNGFDSSPPTHPSKKIIDHSNRNILRWIQEIWQSADTSEEKAKIYTELDVRRNEFSRNLTLKEIQQELLALLQKENASQQTAVNIAQILLFHALKDQADAKYTGQIYMGNVNWTPLKRAAEAQIIDYYSTLLSHDDGSEIWAQQAKEKLSFLAEKLGTVSKGEILQQLATSLELQPIMAKWVQDLCHAYQYQGRGDDHFVGAAELVLDVLHQDMALRRDFISFISTPYDHKLGISLLERLQEKNDSRLKLDWIFPELFYLEYVHTNARESLSEKLETLHENFHLLPANVKIGIYDRLYFPISKQQDSLFYQQSQQDIIEIILPRNNREDFSRPLRLLIENLEDNSLRLMLASLMSSRDIGEGEAAPAILMRRICEAFPPLGIKLAQAFSNHHATPENYRKELEKCQYMAGHIERASLLDLAKKAGYAIGNKGLKRFGRLLGIGSIAYALELEHENDEKTVLYLLKPNIIQQAEYLYQTLMKTANILAAENIIYKEWPAIITQAMDSLYLEVDMLAAKQKAATVSALYKPWQISVGKQAWQHEVVEIFSAEDNSHVEMSLMKGEMLAKFFQQAPENLVQQAAIAELVVEIAHYNKCGAQLELDRHMGNIFVDNQEAHNILGHIDIFGLREKPLEPIEIKQLGVVLGRYVKGLLTQKFFNATAHQGFEGCAVDLKRGCLALSPAAEKAGMVGVLAALGANMKAGLIAEEFVEGLTTEIGETGYATLKNMAITAASIKKVSISAKL